MKIIDKNLCDIWYQALIERASEYTGVFFCWRQNHRRILHFCMPGTKA